MAPRTERGSVPAAMHTCRTRWFSAGCSSGSQPLFPQSVDRPVGPLQVVRRLLDQPHRARGHIGVCVTALSLLGVLRRALERAYLPTSPAQANRACAELHATPVETGGRTFSPQPHAGEQAARVLAAVGEPDLRLTSGSRYPHR